MSQRKLFKKQKQKKTMFLIWKYGKLRKILFINAINKKKYLHHSGNLIV